MHADVVMVPEPPLWMMQTAAIVVVVALVALRSRARGR